MSYQVIARKYRPQRFSHVVGQEHVTTTLTNAIKQNRIAHAYLFVGPRGTGKTTVARIFAKCLNCTDGPSADFADTDPRCQEITEGRSLDVMEIDGASNRGIEEVRELRETVKYVPATSRFKIYIIDEVHMLTKEAFNALLKTLEEPPAHVKFMFATTEPEKILATILSRCQRFDLRRIPVALIVKHLALIAKQEQVQIDEAALHAIARGADGGMRDAESALDQLISFCGAQIVETDVLSMFGLTAQAQIFSLAGAVLEGRSEGVLRDLDALSRNGKDLHRLIADLLSYFRNLLIHKVSQGNPDLLQVSESEAQSIQTHGPLASEDALTRIMEVLADSEGRLRDAASKKIFVEVTLLKAVQARNALNIDTLLTQLRALRSTNPAGPTAPTPTHPPAGSASTPTPPSPSRQPPPTPIAQPATTIKHPQTTELGQLWQEVVEAVGRASAFTRSYLLQAHPVSLARNVLTIGLDPECEDQLELINNQRTHTLLKTKLQELGHPQVQIKFVLAERPTSAQDQDATPKPQSDATPPPVAARASTSPIPTPAQTLTPQKTTPAPPPAAPQKIDPSEFKNDPLIRAALEIFKGQIAEVRA